MRLTTKGRFAVTAMIDLALRQEQGPVTLAGISQRQKISLSYLEQLFGKLRRHEIVESVRGPGGGYSLARRADDVTVADIIIAVDEPLDATQCGGKGNCGGEEHVGGHTGRCMTHDLWATLNQKMVEYLDSVSLQNLVDQQRERQPEVIQDMREARPARRERTPTRARAVDTPATTSVAAEPVKRAPLVNSVFSLAQS
ncbi:MAG: Fe-S cluster assembly transcriptional regulator IscR [Ralstonia sp.]|jgi:Rrf2 family transcriptional regulator, iron-sulfur cluster assembly transcription factor|uniref:Fe-S cluster assembly transcriptional regulator IscR n=2 Tax=Ralstonia pickettii TaxID=329 RepID=A0A2P4RJ55_RALPI|nr:MULTISPECIES: Fe-S cluster assembly transcriptional regulator IscR [Ralstonia]EFP65624.1 iron-sulfur cluster assembly transcription factor IscR [Ralstonia pickettii]EGY65267.1 iron-sulfur cluster assembly transcription factor IscR [Ralstonia sp. 5_2_56FAA]KFL21828.1 iron-sulfur cluster assembly transcription factor IscR [Ralstonia pickettii]MBA4200627.1 Fe-S cluster assembly transcriptional regulator IscR [Ralstonia sp.]MBA4230321.1 Fe-S cluster assembly transcriptional regulator IscR [Rals